jgi:hypothetical protein
MNKKKKKLSKKTEEAIAKMQGQEAYFQFLLDDIRANLNSYAKKDIDDAAKELMEKMKHYDK